MKGIPPVQKLTGLNLSTCYYLSSFIPEWDSPRFVIYFFPDYKYKGTREQKTGGDRQAQMEEKQLPMLLKPGQPQERKISCLLGEGRDKGLLPDK